MEEQAASDDRVLIAQHLMSRPEHWFASSDLVAVFNHVDQSQLDRDGQLTNRKGFHWRFVTIDIDQGKKDPGDEVSRRRKQYRDSKDPCSNCCKE